MAHEHRIEIPRANVSAMQPGDVVALTIFDPEIKDEEENVIEHRYPYTVTKDSGESLGQMKTRSRAAINVEAEAWKNHHDLAVTPVVVTDVTGSF